MNETYFSFDVSMPPYGKKNYIWRVPKKTITECLECGAKHFEVENNGPVFLNTMM